MKLIFATNNAHKVDEIRRVLPPTLQILTLREAGIDTDIPEPHPTLHENAAEKARTIHRMTGTSCFSEDSGLEVQALGGAPGVHSARYAGEERSDGNNIARLLNELRGAPDRSARFRTVICLIWEGREYYFEGHCPGRIIEAPTGTGGFGYDPVFVPEGETRTFAEMSTEEKNRLSHRRKAADQLVTFLNTRC